MQHPTKIAEALVHRLEDGESVLSALKKEMAQGEGDFFREYAIRKLEDTVSAAKAFLSNPQNYMARVGFIPPEEPPHPPGKYGPGEKVSPTTPIPFERKARRWTAAEDKELTAWMTDGSVTAKEIGASMGRTEAAVRGRRHTLKAAAKKRLVMGDREEES